MASIDLFLIKAVDELSGLSRLYSTSLMVGDSIALAITVPIVQAMKTATASHLMRRLRGNKYHTRNVTTPVQTNQIQWDQWMRPKTDFGRAP
jgi:hypothetical protein